MELVNYFNTVYEKNFWKSSETKSGSGSERNHATIKNLTNIVIELIKKYLNTNETLILVDCPCGDFNWIDLLLSKILLETNIKKIKYYAYDIVTQIENDFNNKLIKNNNIEYNFSILDITQQIPIKADIILCKELFIHLSFNDIKKSINNFINSNSLFLICNDFENIENKELIYNNSSYGACREICLTLKPFNLNNFIICYNDYKIWKINNLQLYYDIIDMTSISLG